MAKPITCRFFVGGRPLDELTEQERSDLGARLVGRMGERLNDYFGRDPEAYARAVKTLGANT